MGVYGKSWLAASLKVFVRQAIGHFFRSRKEDNYASPSTIANWPLISL
jgi:hypothetical protein